MQPPEHTALLDLIYETAYEPSLWTRVLERLADSLHGGGGWVSQLDVEDGKGGSLDDPMCRVDPVWAERFVDYYAALNPLNNVSDGRAFLRQWQPIVLTDEDWIEKDVLMRTEYYNDFLEPQDLHSTLWIRLDARESNTATVNISRPKHRGSFEEQDKAVARAYQPHLIRAFKLGQKIGMDRRHQRDTAEVLDLSFSGIFLLDASGRLRYANRAGERMLARSGVVTLRNGKLCAVQPAASKKLEGLIAAASTLDPGLRSGGSMALVAPGREKPFSAIVTPIGRDQFAKLRAQASVCVCITDLQAEGRLPAGPLRDVLGLSPAEARLAQALFEGASLQETAQRYDVSLNTLRAQLSNIFGKTQTNRQSDLIALLSRLSHGLDD